MSAVIHRSTTEGQVLTSASWDASTPHHTRDAIVATYAAARAGVSAALWADMLGKESRRRIQNWARARNRR